ncbi:hypothetical protein, partial [Delftia lacustris]|uniref:hypothetical protein n=1 Tax=Delftia lacustris TaxID=558537 RepID=UPI0019CF7B4E
MRWLPSPSVMDLPGEAELAHALALRGKAPSRAKSNAQKNERTKQKAPDVSVRSFAFWSAWRDSNSR